MQLSDRMIGLLAILGGCAIIYGTFGLRAIPGQQFGSAFFPRILGGVTILAGLVQLGMAGGGLSVTLPGWMRSRAALPPLAVIAGVIAWLALAPVVGFLATTSVLIAALCVVMGGRPFISLAVGVGMAVVFHLIFVSLLRVPLPRGVIEALL